MDGQAYHGQILVGVIVNRAQTAYEHRGILQGYIAMLSVREDYRHLGIGSNLVRATIDLMRYYGIKEVSLETEVTNKAALALYTRLGFIRTRFLPRYYLNGNDAMELHKPLWVSPAGLSNPLSQTSNIDLTSSDPDACLAQCYKEIRSLASVCPADRVTKKSSVAKPVSSDELVPESWYGDEIGDSYEQPPSDDENSAHRPEEGCDNESQNAECDCKACIRSARAAVPWLLNAQLFFPQRGLRASLCLPFSADCTALNPLRHFF